MLMFDNPYEVSAVFYHSHGLSGGRNMQFLQCKGLDQFTFVF